MPLSDLEMEAWGAPAVRSVVVRNAFIYFDFLSLNSRWVKIQLLKKKKKKEAER